MGLEMFRGEPPQTMRLMTYYPPCRHTDGTSLTLLLHVRERRAGPADQGWHVDHRSPVNGGALVVNTLKVLLP
jgi:hypothetical protein